LGRPLDELGGLGCDGLGWVSVAEVEVGDLGGKGDPVGNGSARLGGRVRVMPTLGHDGVRLIHSRLPGLVRLVVRARRGVPSTRRARSFYEVIAASLPFDVLPGVNAGDSSCADHAALRWVPASPASATPKGWSYVASTGV